MPEIEMSDSDLDAGKGSVPTNAAPSPANLDIEGLVRSTALRQGVDPDIAAHIARQESGFDQRQVSPKGAVGVMQLMPNTAKEMGLDPTNMAQNIEGGVRYYKQMLNRFDGDPAKALAAYNAGASTVESGGPLPQETQDYVHSILGGASRGKEVEMGEGDLDPSKESIQFGKLPTQDTSFWGNLKDKINRSAYTAAHVAPYLVGSIPVIRDTPLGAISGPGADAALQMYQRMVGEQTPEGTPAYPVDSKEAAERIRNVFLVNESGEGAAKALEVISPKLASLLYTKALGVKDTATKDAETVADIVEHQIPIGFGKTRAINKWKAPANETLNDIYDKYIPSQTPGLVTTGVAGEQKAQQGASISANTVSKSELKNAYLNDYYKNPDNQTIPQEEKNSAQKAWDNFFSDMPEDMSLKDLRKIKGHIQAKVPYNQRTEGLQQSRKVLDNIMTQHMAAAIPDLADRTKFIQSSQELRKAINAEQLMDNASKSRQLIGGYLAMPLAGAAVGGVSSYYTHSDPASAAARGAVAGALMSPGLPIRGLNLINTPIGRMLTHEGVSQNAATGLGVPNAGISFQELPEPIQNAWMSTMRNNLFGRPQQ